MSTAENEGSLFPVYPADSLGRCLILFMVNLSTRFFILFSKECQTMLPVLPVLPVLPALASRT